MNGSKTSKTNEKGGGVNWIENKENIYAKKSC